MANDEKAYFIELLEKQTDLLQRISRQLAPVRSLSIIMLILIGFQLTLIILAILGFALGLFTTQLPVITPIIP